MDNQSLALISDPESSLLVPRGRVYLFFELPEISLAKPAHFLYQFTKIVL
ncbi:hypothetical protein ON021_22970 [Microcoleus sp. HI-ES]|nr:hypothetical protein [Microcoleus sp. HI-ES]MCZ0902765.1 hypothetical protein [Microcoleus sp. HI-ES]